MGQGAWSRVEEESEGRELPAYSWLLYG